MGPLFRAGFGPLGLLGPVKYRKSFPSARITSFTFFRREIESGKQPNLCVINCWYTALLPLSHVCRYDSMVIKPYSNKSYHILQHSLAKNNASETTSCNRVAFFCCPGPFWDRHNNVRMAPTSILLYTRPSQKNNLKMADMRSGTFYYDKYTL